MSQTPITKTHLYMVCRYRLSRHQRRVFAKALQEVRDSGISYKFCATTLTSAFTWDRSPQGYNFWLRMHDLIEGWEE